MKKIAFRVDASINIGIGHVMRCMTLAEELRNQNADILFICRDLNGNIVQSITNRGFAVKILDKPTEDLNVSNASNHSKWLQVPQIQDANECITIINDFSPDWLVVDHYSINNIWEEKLRPLVGKILVIDDLCDRRHVCDILLDQTYGVLPINYASLVPNECKTFTGAKYALLRSEFYLTRTKALEKRKKHYKISNILISLGGIDKDNISLLCLKACEHLGPKNTLKINLIIGSQNPNIEKLNDYILHSELNITTHIDTESIAELMYKADLAIGAGGTTAWERCALALPTLIISLAENQSQIINNLAKINAVVNIGSSKDITVKKISDALNNVIENPSLLKEMQLRSSDVCDAEGTKRISSELLTASGN